MRKQDFSLCKNNGADQLCGNRTADYRTADQHLCFCNIDSTIPLTFKPLAIFCGCTGQLMADPDGNAVDRFSHDKAQFLISGIRRKTV